MRLTLGIAAIAATFAAASPAFAQSVSVSENALARGLVVTPLTLQRIDHLDFGTVVATAAGGSVEIDANSGMRNVVGVVGVPSAFTRAHFTGYGTAAQTVSLTLTQPATLISGANSIAVDSMSLDSGGATRTIGASGTFDVFVGGRFLIGANQPAGLYSATFQLTAEYQ